MDRNVYVTKIHPYGKHENHVFYWGTGEYGTPGALTFTDRYECWECDQTGDKYQFDYENRVMVWDEEINR